MTLTDKMMLYIDDMIFTEADNMFMWLDRIPISRQEYFISPIDKTNRKLGGVYIFIYSQPQLYNIIEWKINELPLLHLNKPKTYFLPKNGHFVCQGDNYETINITKNCIKTDKTDLNIKEKIELIERELNKNNNKNKNE